jgi:hypothetical protein
MNKKSPMEGRAGGKKTAGVQQKWEPFCDVRRACERWLERKGLKITPEDFRDYSQFKKKIR